MQDPEQSPHIGTQLHVGHDVVRFHVLLPWLEALPDPKVLGNIYNVSCLSSSGAALGKSHRLELLSASWCPLCFPGEVTLLRCRSSDPTNQFLLRWQKLGDAMSPATWAARIASPCPFRGWKGNSWTWGDDARRKSVGDNYLPTRQTKQNISLSHLFAARKNEAHWGRNSWDGLVTGNPPSSPLEPYGPARVAADFCGWIWALMPSVYRGQTGDRALSEQEAVWEAETVSWTGQGIKHKLHQRNSEVKKSD